MLLHYCHYCYYIFRILFFLSLSLLTICKYNICTHKSTVGANTPLCQLLYMCPTSIPGKYTGFPSFTSTCLSFHLHQCQGGQGHGEIFGHNWLSVQHLCMCTVISREDLRKRGEELLGYNSIKLNSLFHSTQSNTILLFIILFVSSINYTGCLIVFNYNIHDYLFHKMHVLWK